MTAVNQIKVEREKVKNILNSENINFYDIESLENVFTLANYKNKENELDLYYLIDKPTFNDSEEALTTDTTIAILAQNLNFRGNINLYNLKNKENNIKLARTFGLSDAYNPAIRNENNYNTEALGDLYITMDVEDNYDKNEDPYLMGYNSTNYDLTMLSYYLYETFSLGTQPQYLYVELSQKEIETVRNNYEPQDPRLSNIKYIFPNGAEAIGDIVPLPFNNSFAFRYQNPNVGKTIIEITPPSAKRIRTFNNELFSKDFIGGMSRRLEYDSYDDYLSGKRSNYNHPMAKIRKNMLLTGRHIDVSNLNEKQARVGLKRLLGTLGYQILESDKLDSFNATINNRDDFLELVAYNVSDVVNLELLFTHKVYYSQFTLKRSILARYPELIYEKQENSYQPDINPLKVRRDRLTIDSTSAKFAEKSLAPYGPLNDIEFVSFNYPSQRYIDSHPELNLKQVNMLEVTKNNFYKMFPQPELREKFDHIYNYYKNIEGKNFNNSKQYKLKYGTLNEVYQIDDFKGVYNNIFYYHKDGSPSSCFINMSTGGAHGQELAQSLLDDERKDYNKQQEYFDYVKALTNNDPYQVRVAKTLTMPDGVEKKWNYFLKSGATLKDPSKSKWKDIKRGVIKEAFPINTKTGLAKRDDKLVYTSFDYVIHEDYKSFYPWLLTMMSAFYNEELGYDRYAEFYEAKEINGKLSKDMSLSEDERADYAQQRENNKLIINAASGKADSQYDCNITMNNTIISMRIIGQLFIYSLAQAQTYHGAKIISTNTDGLYSNLEETLNNQILEQEAKKSNIIIEPEPMYLISKDSNCRIELSTDLKTIYSASGSDLSCYKGPNPSQALDHPAIQDWALTEYFKYMAQNNISFSKEFDKDLARQIYESAEKTFDNIKYLNMFQNIISSSPKAYSYVYGKNLANNETKVLQHYNRMFKVKENTKDSIFIENVLARKLTPATIKKRKENNERDIQHDIKALDLLKYYGVELNSFPEGREASFQKVSKVDLDQPVLIENRALNQLSEDYVAYLKNHIDIDAYIKDLEDTFNKNWKNTIDNRYEHRNELYGLS